MLRIQFLVQIAAVKTGEWNARKQLGFVLVCRNRTWQVSFSLCLSCIIADNGISDNFYHVSRFLNFSGLVVADADRYRHSLCHILHHLPF